MFETLSSWQVSIGVVRRPEDGRDLMPLHGSGTPGRGSLAGHRRNCNSRGLPTPRLPSQCAVIGSSMLQASGHSSVYVWMCVCVCACAHVRMRVVIFLSLSSPPAPSLSSPLSLTLSWCSCPRACTACVHACHATGARPTMTALPPGRFTLEDDRNINILAKVVNGHIYLCFTPQSI